MSGQVSPGSTVGVDKAYDVASVVAVSVNFKHHTAVAQKRAGVLVEPFLGWMKTVGGLRTAALRRAAGRLDPDVHRLAFNLVRMRTSAGDVYLSLAR